MKNATTRQHYEKYRDLAKECGMSMANSVRYGTKEEIMKKYVDDKNLNNIPLYRFDQHVMDAKIYCSALRNKSLAEGVCMIKHLLIYEVLGLEPEFIN